MPLPGLAFLGAAPPPVRALMPACPATARQHPAFSPRAGDGEAASEADAAHMRRALDLARTALGQTHPNPAVGCVIVDPSGRVVG